MFPQQMQHGKAPGPLALVLDQLVVQEVLDQPQVQRAPEAHLQVFFLVPVLEEVFFLVQRAPEVPVLDQPPAAQVQRAPKVLVLFMVLNQPPAARVQRAPEVQVLDQQVVQEVFSKNLTDSPRICL